jgi:hypothetical protein
MARAQAEAKSNRGTKPNPSAKPFPQVLYETVTRTSSAQWDRLLRHPWFLRPVSLYFQGVLTLVERSRMVVGFGLRLMNVPTREEIAALDRKLDLVQEQLDELTAHLVRSEPAAKVTRPAARKPTARRTTTTRRRTARAMSPKTVSEAAPEAAASDAVETS